MRVRALVVVLVAVMVAGCSSTGTLGMAVKSMADPGSLLKGGRGYTEIGPAYSQSCRFTAIGIIPWGNGTAAAAIDDALAASGGDALLNVSITNSLYTFIPYWNVFCYTCTSVSGVAVKFDPPKTP